MPFEILPHTADMRIRATGTTLEELFIAAAQGMMSLIKKDYAVLKPDPARHRVIKLRSLDQETLLIEFLSELLATIDTNNEIYPELRLTRLTETKLTAELVGAPVENFDEDIKAVTYHEVSIKTLPDGSYETTVLFDI